MTLVARQDPTEPIAHSHGIVNTQAANRNHRNIIRPATGADRMGDKNSGSPSIGGGGEGGGETTQTTEAAETSVKRGTETTAGAGPKTGVKEIIRAKETAEVSVK